MSKCPRRHETEATEGDTTKQDIAFKLLSDHLRHQILLSLNTHEEPTLSELATALQESERIPETDLERIKIQLYHNHLPKLEDAELIDYDSSQRTITRRQLPAPIKKTLKISSNCDESPADV
ncbi:DUF7344 domain-containing protein [Halomicrococcus sp. NG-SE-24]|uniref:DUF7344 domain-containing protein n=1 Tax=Halomicrococcus sp. NG-SE-24 TaxID=3436928 RepID=UPI003D99FAE0